jgi:uncharacterized RDD family membrane protein YckC
MRQRFQVRDPNSWAPLLFIFGTVLYAAVELMDRGLGALTFWFLVTATEIGVVLFLHRRNYVELGDGHLTWVQWGHKRYKVAFSQMKQVALKGTLVSILLPDASQLGRFGFFRRAPVSSWLTIPAVDPKGLASTIEGLLGVYGGRDANLTAEDSEPPTVPKIELVPAARWRRLLATALDAFVLVSLLCTVALAKTAHLKDGEEADGTGFYLLVVVSAWILYIWITNVIGVSLGKLQFGLRVVRAGTDQAPGALLGTTRMLVALSGFAISLLAMFLIPIPVFYVGVFVFLIEYTRSLVRRDRRALHDVVAGTQVVQTVYRLDSD